MQPITGSPRNGLTAAQVRTILTTSAAVEMDFGCEWYDRNLNYSGDVTKWLQPGSSVTSDSNATIHRSATLIFDSDAPFNPLSDFLKPYVTLTDADTGVAARFNLGVYVLASPEHEYTFTPSSLSYSGYDLLQLLDQPIGDSYEVAVGTDPIEAAVTVLGLAIPSASVAYEPKGTLTSVAYTWTDSPTYLNVINDLLGSAGYLSAWVDWDGVFQFHDYVNPADQLAEWTFDLSLSNNVVAEPRVAHQDLFDTPNWWRFVISNLDTTPVEGVTQFTYEDDSANPTSVPSRGRAVKRSYSVDAVDYASMVSSAKRQITLDIGPSETFSVTAFPLPLVWHRDIFLYLDPSLDGDRTVLCHAWSLPLDASGDMSMTWTTVRAV